MISPLQIKAARALLDIKQKDLAKKAGVSIATLNNIERGAQTDPRISTMQSIEQALQKDGIVFLDDAFEGVGVQLKPKSAAAGQATILIIDDNKSDRTLYKNWLLKSGKKYRVQEADNARAGFDAFVEYKPSCIILDFMMYGADGFQLLAALKREHAQKLPPIIFVTGMHNDVMEESAKSQGVYKYLNKQTMNREDLYAAVEGALKM